MIDTVLAAFERRSSAWADENWRRPRTTERTLSCPWPRASQAKWTTPECLWSRSVIPMENASRRIQCCSDAPPSPRRRARNSARRTKILVSRGRLLQGGSEWVVLAERSDEDGW